MLVGVAYQVIMGLIIVFVRVQPIIVSLSGYLALAGLNLIILPRPGGVAPNWMLNWGAGTTIWSPILVILIIATAAWYVLANSAFFGHLRLMGSDERAAYTSGVRINIVRIGAHCVAGVYAGLAAICLTALISSGDPTQGTTFTLMSVTALVLGGANLAGGRGGAFGSMLGALNIYLINYVLGTFNFGRFQSFVTDLSYGTILVASLLISLALPQIQKGARYLSPAVFVALLAALAGGVIMHAVMDVSSIVTRHGAATAQVVTGGAPNSADASMPAGTYILLAIFAIAAAIYLLVLLSRYPRRPMIGFLVLVAATVLGLIFHGRTIGGAANVASPGRDIGTALQYLSLESLEFGAKSSQYDFIVVFAAYAMLLALGITLFATIVIQLNMPQKATAAFSTPVVLAALVIAVLAVLTFVSIKLDGDARFFATDSLVSALAAMILFVLLFSPLQGRIPNVSNVYIAIFALIAIGFVYFSASPRAPGTSAVEYIPSVLSGRSADQFVDMSYPSPHRFSPSPENPSVSQWAYSILVIILLQFAIWMAMARGYLLREFWRFGHIVCAGIIMWGAFFYSIGVSFWNIVIVITAAAVTAPLVWRVWFVRNSTLGEAAAQ